jgi:hypothetical protein
VWSLAAIVTLFSLASSIIHSHDASDHAIYAGVAAAHGVPADHKSGLGSGCFVGA